MMHGWVSRSGPRSHAGASRLVRTIALSALVALVVPWTASHAAKKEYSYETNPVRLGRKALEEGKVSEAKAQFEEAIANEWELPGAKAGLAEVKVLNGNLEDAEPLFRESIAMQSTPEAHAGLGLLLLRMGRVDEAKIED